MKLQSANLEDAVNDSRSGKYNVQKSDYYWISVLRKLYKHAQVAEKQPGGLLEIISLLEEALYQGTNKFGILPRTAQLFLGVEQKNYELVNKLLDNDYNPYMFLKDTLTRPWNIFPTWSSYNSDVRASPIGKLT